MPPNSRSWAIVVVPEPVSPLPPSPVRALYFARTHLRAGHKSSISPSSAAEQATSGAIFLSHLPRLYQNLEGLYLICHSFHWTSPQQPAHLVRWLLWRAPFLSPTAPTSLSPRALFWSQCRACCFASPRFPFASSTTIIVTSRILDEVLHHFLGSAKKFLTSRGWAGDAMLSCMRRNGGRSKKVF